MLVLAALATILPLPEVLLASHAQQTPSKPLPMPHMIRKQLALPQSLAHPALPFLGPMPSQLATWLAPVHHLSAFVQTTYNPVAMRAYVPLVIISILRHSHALLVH